MKLKRYRYTGMERDEETGLNYHGTRYYAPWLARWTSCDPLGERAGVNDYRYVSSSPINYLDPEGLAESDDWAPRYKVVDKTKSPVVPEDWHPPDKDAPPEFPLSHADFSFRYGQYDEEVWKNFPTHDGIPKLVPLINIKVERELETARPWKGTWIYDIEIDYANGITFESKEGKLIMEEGNWYPIEQWNELSRLRSSLSSDVPYSHVPNTTIAERLTTDYLLNFDKASRSVSLSPLPIRVPEGLNDSANKIGQVWAKAWSLALSRETEGTSHYLGPQVGPLGLNVGINPTASPFQSLDLNQNSATPPSSGALSVLEPGTGAGYSYLRRTQGSALLFSLGISPTSERVPYHAGGGSKPFTGPGRGPYLGIRFSVTW